ncbi:hypothetical protein KCP78_20485 [Salmonella enterica subsp. enterica]|nr:hypothetical protein KCP78_20485 [Salmonella enterica subsp. enterica]
MKCLKRSAESGKIRMDRHTQQKTVMTNRITSLLAKYRGSYRRRNIGRLSNIVSEVSRNFGHYHCQVRHP